jgi:endoglucanase
MLRLAFIPALAMLSLAADTAIKVDQVGYLPAAQKIAFVTAQAGKFAVKRADSNAVVFEGKLGAAEAEPDSGDQVRPADFSSVKQPGKYYVEVPGVGRSVTFAIGKDAFTRAYYLAMRAFYGQRCGTRVDLGPEFPGYSYDACHLEQKFHTSSGRQGPSKTVGGWHDAGDYGRYVVNSGITTGTLLWTWEVFGPKVRKVSLNIPESKNKTPDILDEIRWNLEWMLGMQDEDGGAWHKQTTAVFSGFVMPRDDKMPSEIIGTGSAPYKGTCATADLAAVAAIAARVYRPYDKAFAERALRAARRGWTWAEQNPNVLFRNPQGVNTGAYGDGNCSDERLWAAAELWRTTGEPAFEKYFVDNYAAHKERLKGPAGETWRELAPFAYWTYVLSGRKGAVVEEVRQATLDAARAIAERTLKHPYRISMTNRDYVWGSNGVVANYGLQLLVANAIHPDPQFVEAAAGNLHYLLGANTFSISWVTQVGANAYKNPHHRPSGADKNPEPWPGMLSGGPNRVRQDPAMKKLPDGPPAKMYIDHQDSYASNEIAINWQAPLVFLLAAMLE